MSRWAFWGDGYWWWRAPTGVMYVYVNDAYTPYAPDVVPVYPPQTQPTSFDEPEETTPVQTQGQEVATDSSYKSPDGKRLVQVVGDEKDAFLYDTSGEQPVYLKFLTRGAEKVRFTPATASQPIQILVDLKDGTFKLFESSGEAMNP